MRKIHFDKQSDVGLVMAQHVRVVERIQGIESEITIVKLAVAAGGQAPLRAPPGYARPCAQSSPVINMKDPYAAGGCCGGPPGHDH